MALYSYGKHTHVAVFFPGAGCAAELQRQAVACHRCRRCQEVQGTDMCVDMCIDVGVDMCADMRIEMRNVARQARRHVVHACVSPWGSTTGCHTEGLSGIYSHNQYRYGIYSSSLYSYGLYSYGPCGYGLCCYGCHTEGVTLYRGCLHSYGL